MSERHEEPFHSNDVDRVGSQQYDVDITTRSGDQGTSCLYNGKRFPKSDIHFEVLGSLDECNSFIGLSREFLSDSCSLLDTYLENVQCLLFDVCAAVATPLHQSKERQLNKTQLAESHVLELEKWSYLLNQELPKQDSFILPSGGKAASHLHVSRAICRRAERSLSILLQDKDICPCVYQYVNRLSDFLFIAARYASLKEGIDPKKWHKL